MQEMLFVFNQWAFQKEKTGNQVEETTQETKQNFPELKKPDFKIERIYQMSNTEWREAQTLPERQGFLYWVLSSGRWGDRAETTSGGQQQLNPYPTFLES